MQIKVLYEDAIRFEDSLLAHYIFYLLQEKEITLEDDSNALKIVRVDNQRFSDLYQKNPLGFSQIKAYALKHSNKYFSFIFANNQQEAITFFKETYRRQPLNCHEYALDISMSFGNRFLTFREMRKEHKQFPSIIGIYEKKY